MCDLRLRFKRYSNKLKHKALLKMGKFRIFKIFIFLVSISSVWSQDYDMVDDLFKGLNSKEIFKGFSSKELVKDNPWISTSNEFRDNNNPLRLFPSESDFFSEENKAVNGGDGGDGGGGGGEGGLAAINPGDGQTGVDNINARYFNLFTSAGNVATTTQESDIQGLMNRYEPILNHISKVCPKETFFAGFDPNHRQAVNELATIYGEQGTLDGLVEMSNLLRASQQIHPQVWYQALIRAQLLQMPDTLFMDRPSPLYLFPTRFFPETVLQSTGPGGHQCIPLDERVGADNGADNKLWYFREDVQLNAHHWVWHLLYPFNTTLPIDRRGEFFYFTHHELVARYTAERLSNGFAPPSPLNLQLDSVIEEGYNAHMVDGVSTRPFAPRAPYQSLAENLNQTGYETLFRLTQLRDRVLDILFTGHVYRGSQKIPIHTVDNINQLGELSEASYHSVDPEFYGGFGYHNEGHVLIASLIGNAPPGSLGVMGDQATAMRDVIFYRWHKLVDVIFQTYKATHLAPYKLHDGPYPLVFKGVKVTGLEVIPEGGMGNTNILNTYWNTKEFNIQGGLDFNSINQIYPLPPNINVCAKHLDHEEFTYKIKIKNSRQEATKATIRIFLAPRYKSLKHRRRFTIAEQRLFFFSLDSFTTYLNPGENLIKRNSIESTLTAPFPRSIEKLRQDIVSGVQQKSRCECGYPHHLLLPKGTEEGMVFDLFVMVTDAAEDQVNDFNNFGFGQQFSNDHQQCTPSHIHCGIPGRSYPDSKPMGYPFDRRPFKVPKAVNDKYDDYEYGGRGHSSRPKEVVFLEDYIGYVPNMGTTQVKIVHKNVQLGLAKEYGWEGKKK